MFDQLIKHPIFLRDNSCNYSPMIFFLSNGEFDPGSGRTLEVCLIHASRTRFEGACFFDESGARVSNAWVTCLEVWDNIGKPMLIPTNFYYCMVI